MIILTLSIVILIYIAGWATTIVFRSSIIQTEKLFSSKCVCDHCGEKINSIYTLPILGYLYLKGRTKCCGNQITNIYTIIELALIITQIMLLILLKSFPLLCAKLLFMQFAFVTTFFSIKHNGLNIKYFNLLIGNAFAVIAYISIWFMLFVNNIIYNSAT